VPCIVRGMERASIYMQLEAKFVVAGQECLTRQLLQNLPVHPVWSRLVTGNLVVNYPLLLYKVESRNKRLGCQCVGACVCVCGVILELVILVGIYSIWRISQSLQEILTFVCTRSVILLTLLVAIKA
jgi:hypothetical protein